MIPLNSMEKKVDIGVVGSIFFGLIYLNIIKCWGESNKTGKTKWAWKVIPWWKFC